MPWDPPQVLPYCGAPPAPDAIWSRWNLDPVLLLALVVLGCAYAAGARRAGHGNRAIPGRAQAAFGAGWLVTALALVSPLCALSVSLFAARVGQHMLLTLVGAPLVAAGRPAAAFAALFGSLGWRKHLRSDASVAPLCAAWLFGAVLWFWHAPAPYAATFASTPVYWAMHLSLYGSAVWLWTCLLDRSAVRMMHGFGASLISTVQMGFLGALITLAPRAVYAPHALTTSAWGLSALQDQQLGGAIMWVPGCVVFLAASMLALWLGLRDTELRAAALDASRPASAA